MIAGLTEEFDRLAEALELLDSDEHGAGTAAGLTRIRALQDRMESRLRAAPHVLVVGLAGTTGAGKSSLFNALIGRDHSEVGARRPTTSRAVAAIITESGAQPVSQAGPQAAPEAASTTADVGPLLDWLQVDDRVLVADPPRDLGPSVVIDLPDIDSTAPENRSRAEALIEVVDVLLWVVDPEKYADSRLHETYLRPMAAHAPVMSVVVNQVDRLTQADGELVTSDLAQRLARGGIDSDIYPTSVATGRGIDRLAEAIHHRALQKRAQVDRLAADARVLASDLRETAPVPTGPVPSGALQKEVVASAGVPAYAAGLAELLRYDLRRRTTWPPFRLFHRSRKAPGIPELTTRYLASPLSRFSAALTGPGMWEEGMDRAALAGGTQLQSQLRTFPATRGDRARPRPGWATPMGRAQWFGLVLLLAAVVMLGAEVGLRYFGFTIPPALESVPAEPGYPALPALRWSAAIAAAGIALSLVVGSIAIALRASSVRRFRRTTEREVGAEIAGLVAGTVITPVERLAAAAAQYGQALETIGHITRPRTAAKVRRARKAP